MFWVPYSLSFFIRGLKCLEGSYISYEWRALLLCTKQLSGIKYLFLKFVQKKMKKGVKDFFLCKFISWGF